MPSIAVDITAAPESVPETGADVAFVVTVINNSPEAAQLTELTDSVYDNLLALDSCATTAPVLLAGNDTYTCTFSRLLAANFGSAPQQNTVQAAAMDDEGNTTSADNAVSLPFTDVLPEIDVSLSVSPTQVPESGGNVTYRVAIDNRNAETITLDALADAILGPLNGKGNCVADGVLRIPGATVHRCAFTQRVQEDFDASPQRFVVEAAVSDDDGNTDASEGRATLRITNVPSDIELTQTASASSLPESGDTLAYTLTVANRSPADAITITQLTSSEFGDVSAVAGPIAATDCDLPLDLERDETATCHFTAFTIGNANQTVAHRVTSSGIDDDDDSVEASSSTAITFTDLPSSLTISATISAEKVPRAGQTVFFTPTIVNTSQADTVEIARLTAADFGDIADPANANLAATNCTVPQTLRAGAAYRCDFAVILGGALDDTFSSQITAGGRDDDGNVLSAVSATNPVTVAEPVLEVSKTDLLFIDADADQVVTSGDTLLYRLQVDNVGNDDAFDALLTDTPDDSTTLLNDTVQTSTGTVLTGNGAGEATVAIELGTLSPGDQALISFQVVVNESASIGQLYNQAAIQFGSAVRGAANPVTVLSDDPDTPPSGDATVTPLNVAGGLIFLPLVAQ